MNPEPSRIKNPGAFRWLVLIIGLVAFASWLLAKPRWFEVDPPIVAFIAIGLASLILFDDCKD